MTTETILNALTPTETVILLVTSLDESARILNKQTAYKANVAHSGDASTLAVILTPKGAGLTSPLAEITIPMQPPADIPVRKHDAFTKMRNRKLCEANALLQLLIDSRVTDPTDLCKRKTLTGAPV